MVLEVGHGALAISNVVDVKLATVQSDDIFRDLLTSDIRSDKPDLCSMTDHHILYYMGHAAKKLLKHKESIGYFKVMYNEVGHYN